MNDLSFNQPAGEKRSMFQIMIDAVTKPTVETYERLAAEPAATIANGALVVFLALLIGVVVGGLVGLPFQNASIVPLESLLQDVPPEYRSMLQNFGGGGSIASLVCAAPFTAAAGLFFYFIGMGIQSWIARLFGGTGSFDRFFFVNAAYNAPIALVTNLLSGIPVLGCLGALLSIYSLYLNFLSLRAVHRLEAGKAILVILIPTIVGCLLLVCCLVALLTLLGPAIGEVFSEINNSLMMP